MSFIRKVVRKNRDGTTKIYYEEVESVRISGRVTQRHIRSLGTDPENPTTFGIDSVHFGYIATRLMQGDLSANELLDMVEGMGHSVPREDLEGIGIRYSIKKNDISISLYYARRSGRRKHAGSAGEKQDQ